MSTTDSFRLLAHYNQWMNDKLYSAAASLPGDVLAAPRGAFFGSILGTLNHIAVGDTLWLKRFAHHPADFTALRPVVEVAQPRSLDSQLFNSFTQLANHRRWLDERINVWVQALASDDLAQTLHYRNSAGIAHARQFDGLVLHFFNHQTHHRGQASTLLSQAGVDIGVTDLLALLPQV